MNNKQSFHKFLSKSKTLDILQCYKANLPDSKLKRYLQIGNRSTDVSSISNCVLIFWAELEYLKNSLFCCCCYIYLFFFIFSGQYVCGKTWSKSHMSIGLQPLTSFSAGRLVTNCELFLRSRHCRSVRNIPKQARPQLQCHFRCKKTYRVTKI